MPNKSEDFRGLKILHSALLAGLMMIIILITFFLAEGDFRTLNTEIEPMLIAGVGVAIFGMVASGFMYNNKMSSLTGDPYAEENFGTFREANILKWALLEGPALINIIFFFLNENGIHFYLALALWLMLFMARPRI